jgi:hypothetical protein
VNRDCQSAAFTLIVLIAGAGSLAALALPLQGDDFLKGWSDKTAGALFDKIISTMPANEPGTISDQQSADLVAYILKLNHFPAGQEPLPRDPAALNAILLAPK